MLISFSWINELINIEDIDLDENDYGYHENKSYINVSVIKDIEVENITTAALDFPMPSAVEIVKLLNQTGAGYIYDITLKKTT